MGEGVRLVLFPGIGADHRLFEPQLARFEGARVPGWIEPKFRESLRSYGKRMLGVVGDGPVVLGGFSFGGQVALEMASEVALRRSRGDAAPEVRGVVLIASCRGSAVIDDGFRRRERMSRLLPGWVVRRAMVGLAPKFARKNGLGDGYASVLEDMARTADVGFTRWSARAASEWVFGKEDRRMLGEAGITVHQIHGEHDDVIPLVRKDADAVIVGGPHLITWTHADDVNSFIARAM